LLLISQFFKVKGGLVGGFLRPAPQEFLWKMAAAAPGRRRCGFCRPVAAEERRPRTAVAKPAAGNGPKADSPAGAQKIKGVKQKI